MGRFLAQLGDLGAQSPDTNTSAGSGHTSTSSVSTTQTSSSMRLSQSSISSLGVLDDEVSEEREELSSHEKAIRRGSYSISTAVRRKPYEPSLPSPTSPPLLTPKTPFFSPSVKHTPSTSSKSPRVQTTLPTQPKHQKRPSMAQGSFKTASSMSGVSAGAPLVSWVDSVGKKLGQLHAQAGSSGAGTGAQHIHKRASTLLSDASHSLFAALTSPIIPTPSSRREHTPPTPYSAKSLLDDDDALGDWAGMATLSPDLPKLTPTQTSQSGSLAPVSSAEPQDNIVNSSETDSEEWNW
ncbi:hypothetical protein EW145_g7782 [Phellinidium pouzarii]|uniref:Uncharacterized protein n=1 Tax=Phellinidium pouzarii TaxID=167371 RepID=A0A4S4KEN0_9AGAM|nr:hypothetical protein EW145_g7782 [Phellinidium pouzarii]